MLKLTVQQFILLHQHLQEGKGEFLIIKGTLDLKLIIKA